jgi:uncharacterized protein (TIGR02271 family)
MRDTYERTNIQPGWDVYGSDDEHLGSVDEVRDSYLIIQKGLFFPKDIYVPFSAVTRADENGVILDVTKSELESRDWSEPPIDLEGDRTSAAAYDTTGYATDTTTTGRTTADVGTDIGTDRERMALHEEELEARKTTRQAGEVEVRKNVVEEQQEFDVPVAREEVRVRRVPVSGAGSSDATTAAAFDEDRDTIRVPVMEEEVEVTKRPVVREEIEIEKVVRQDTQRVSDTVRREEAEVRGDAVELDQESTGTLRSNTTMDEEGDYRR